MCRNAVLRFTGMPQVIQSEILKDKPGKLAEKNDFVDFVSINCP